MQLQQPPQAQAAFRHLSKRERKAELYFDDGDDAEAKTSYHTRVHAIFKLRPRSPSASPRQPRSKHEGLR